MSLIQRDSNKVADALDGFILIVSIITFLFWFTGQGLFYSETGPVLSPLTSFSLALMVLTRIATRHFTAWSTPLSMAFLGIVACGNLTSIWALLLVPDLFIKTIPGIVPTSILTSTGIILLCLYEILVSLRETPKKAFILDDILLHLALFPGGLSLLGHLIGVDAYISTTLDPRVGVSPIEMVLMASFTVSAVLTNPDLFLWKFLSESLNNKIIFGVLFANQYVAAFAVGFLFRSDELSSRQFGLEFFVMLAGVLATLGFLSYQAFVRARRNS